MSEVDLDWDAGDMGCGELLMQLRLKMEQLKRGQKIKVIAKDPGAIEDMPAWCNLTGHRLLTSQHPDYLIEKK